MAQRRKSTQTTVKQPAARRQREQQAIIARLKTAYAVAATAVAALEGQAADRDIEIAQALTRCVLDPIADAIEFVEGRPASGP